MAARRAWVLNLDADLELAAGRPYEPSRRVASAMKVHAIQLAATLLAEGDVVVDETSVPLCARGRSGHAFCPTRRAIAILRRAGAEPEPHPPVDVLCRVNSRAFAASLGETLPGARFVTDQGVALAILRAPTPLGGAWRVKHAFGMAGRNQRVVTPSQLDDRDVDFVTRGIRGAGVQIEPNVAIDDEYAIHGLLDVEGTLTAGTLVRQRCDARGAWTSTDRLSEDGRAHAHVSQVMNEELRHVGAALHVAGYFGPFGIDAYAYRGEAGEPRFQRRSEINARYSMGFAVGFREDAPPHPPR
jgi:hypothetical protein